MKKADERMKDEREIERDGGGGERWNSVRKDGMIIVVTSESDL